MFSERHHFHPAVSGTLTTTIEYITGAKTKYC